MGDALAMTLLVRKGFREEQFASLHPGGKLGRRLMRVEHVMHAGDGGADRADVDRDGGRLPRDVEQTARHDVRRRTTADGSWGSSRTATCDG